MSQNGQNNTPMFSIEKIYLQDASLEIPHAPQVFLERETPQIEIQLTNGSESIEETLHQCSVTVTVTAKLASKTLFLIEVKKAGVFRIANIPADDMPVLLNITCPNILFPYVREVVTDLSTRAGFPPVILNPVNFEVLYHQQQQQAASSAPASSTVQ
ncbi:MAG: protein-export chaperone SecB [Betaproteobacteria bacterium]|jgi:protein translocase subunit secB|nr:protein-export chaperone SecB [Betaproteobacteria bacterium]